MLSKAEPVGRAAAPRLRVVPRPAAEMRGAAQTLPSRPEHPRKGCSGEPRCKINLTISLKCLKNNNNNLLMGLCQSESQRYQL